MGKVTVVEQWSLSGVRRLVRGRDGKVIVLDEVPNLLGWLPKPLELDLTPFRKGKE